MSIFDAIRKSVLENFDTSLSALEMVLGLAVSLAAALFILFVYQNIMRQSSVNRSFCISLLLVCGISSMMVLTITSNLALSLGMVGALSIIRFRTAVKDASDTAFLFWSVAAGITAGAGFYLLTLIGCLFVGAICVIATLLFGKLSKPFLLVVRMSEPEAAKQVAELLAKSGLKHTLSSHVENERYAEVIYELGMPAKKKDLVPALRRIPGVSGVSLVDCQKS